MIKEYSIDNMASFKLGDNVKFLDGINSDDRTDACILNKGTALKIGNSISIEKLVPLKGVVTLTISTEELKELCKKFNI